MFLTTSWAVSFPSFPNIRLTYKARYRWVCLKLWPGFREILPIPSRWFKNLLFAAFLLIHPINIVQTNNFVYRTNFVPKPLFSVSLGKLVIPRRDWKQWLCKIMESKQEYYGQCENGKILYRFQFGEESESPGSDIIPSDRCMFQSLWLLYQG